MFSKSALLVFAAAALGACTHTQVQSAGGTLAPVTPATARLLPAGSELMVRTNSKLSGKDSHVGEEFSATVTDNLVAENGQIAVPEGAMVYGHITGMREAPHAGDPSVIKVDFDRLVVNGRSRAFNAKVVKVESPSVSNQTLKAAGIGAVAGAALGAIISGGEFGGIATGGALGAAAGTVISLGTNREPELPEGSRMTLRTQQSVNLR
jgi:hypothetical protein